MLGIFVETEPALVERNVARIFPVGDVDVVILQQYQAARVPQLKAANPGLKVLMYKNLSGMTERTGSPVALPTRSLKFSSGATA